MTGWWIIVFLFVLFGKPRESLQCSISSVEVSHNASDTPLIGDNELYIISCNVSIVGCTDSDNMTDLTISWNLVGIDLMYNEISNGIFFNNFTIGGPVNITNAQVYNCTAELESVTDPMTKSNSTTFSVTFQTPSVDVTNTTASVGDTAMLNCTVTVTNDISSLVEPTIVWASPGGTFTVGMTSNNGNSFVSQLTVSSVSSVSSAGEYTCSASIAPKNKYIHVIPSANGTGSGNLYAIEYSFNASETVRLDVAPYNDFILQCSVTYFPKDSSPTISFSFTDNNTMDSSVQTNDTVSNNPRRSQLAVNITAASGETEFTYSCEASVSFVGSETFTEQNSISITVRGPASPLPALLLDSSESPTSVIVQWNVSRVSYTPENFTVFYGLEPGSLNYSMSAGRSNNIMEEGFLTDTDQKYSVTIENLASATQYFYQILSNNTFNVSRSDIGNFTTGDAVPSEPTDVRLDVVSATELTLRWGPPDLPNGDITHYNYSCAGVNDTEPMFNDSNSVLSSTFSVPFSGLSPFIEYQCNVTASTSAGAGSPGTDTAITAQAAPTGEPLNFQVTSNNDVPDQLILSWKQPRRDLRNGIITNYLYNCAEVDVPSNVFSGSTSMNTTTITGLKVFTNYTCRVRAATEVGEGPAAVFMDARTGEDEPSSPSSLVSIGLNSSAFNVILGRPDRPNGIVTHYVITVVRYRDGNIRAQENSLTEFITITSSNLMTGIPYNISAYAVTGGGGGPPITITNFTQQGIPRSITPNVERINRTAMIVSWEPLSIVDAMGFVSGYTVTATPTNSRKRQAEPLMKTVGSSVTSVTFSSLDGDTIYIVTVIASNGETDGPTSSPYTVFTFPTEKPKDNNTGVIVGVTFLGVFILSILIVIIVILMVYLMRANTTKNVEIHSNPLVLEKNGGEENGGELKLLSIRTDQGDYGRHVHYRSLDLFD